ncbi:MAG TPA: hypothetical protein VF172_07890 [Nitrososphaera sp.]|jgi:hypothetical protein
MQNASLGHTGSVIKRTIYAAAAIGALVIWSYYSGIMTACMCVEGAMRDCTNYEVEATETTGVVLFVWLE